MSELGRVQWCSMPSCACEGPDRLHRVVFNRLETPLSELLEAR